MQITDHAEQRRDWSVAFFTGSTIALALDVWVFIRILGAWGRMAGPVRFSVCFAIAWLIMLWGYALHDLTRRQRTALNYSVWAAFIAVFFALDAVAMLLGR